MFCLSGLRISPPSAPAATLNIIEIKEKIKATSNPIKIRITIIEPGISNDSVCPKVTTANKVAKIATPPITTIKINTIALIKNVNAVTSNPAIAPLLGEVSNNT